jgi:hypothetical protein
MDGIGVILSPVTERQYHPETPEWAKVWLTRLTIQLDRLRRDIVADISQAETDLAGAVSAVAQRVQTDIAALQAAIASGAGDKAALQAAADAIESQVATLTNVDPANPPTPAPPVAPAPDAGASGTSTGAGVAGTTDTGAAGDVPATP